MFAQCAVRHTSLGEAVIIGVANIICRRQTSFKKRTFVGRQKCVFCWLRRWDLKGPLENIVASVAYAWRASDAPYFLPCRARFTSHRERSRSKPTTSSVGRGGAKHTVAKNKGHQFGVLVFWLRRWDLNLTASGL